MPTRICPRHANDHPCTCAMGNLYRFIEPVLLFMLKQKGRAHGYELGTRLREHSFTDAEIEVSALYRTLRQLEQNDCVTSEWDVEGSGPARRQYQLTPRGKEHLEEWLVVLTHMSESMSKFVMEARSETSGPGSKPRAARSLRPFASPTRAERAAR
jgi:PadR family transcriptional regulator, regulatory protein PadR